MTRTALGVLTSLAAANATWSVKLYVFTGEPAKLKLDASLTCLTTNTGIPAIGA